MPGVQPADEVRPAAGTDADRIADIYRHYVLNTAISFETEPPDAQAVRGRMAAARMPWLVAVRDDAVVGYAYASPHRSRRAYRWSVEVSVYLDHELCAGGIGTRLYRRLLSDVQQLGYVSAFAGIALPNPASVALHERLGFSPVGVFGRVGFKHGTWHDVGWWQLPLGDAPEHPAEPLPCDGD